MSVPRNPFLDRPKAQAGHGTIKLANLAQGAEAARPAPVLQTMEYQYPLKLVAPEPLTVTSATAAPNGASGNDNHDLAAQHGVKVYSIFLLSYGGGLVAGDTINLTITLEPSTRLNILTQGSTKVFKIRPGQPSSNHAVSVDELAVPPLTQQHLTVHVGANAALVYLPDPVQPFADSRFAQHQRYILENRDASLCVLDWVTSGRSARGEHWSCRHYESRNEVYAAPSPSSASDKGHLLVRDNVILSADESTSILGEEPTLASRVHDWSVIGTLIIHGPLLASLAKLFLDEFAALPRVGAPRSILLPWVAGEDQGLGEESETGRARRKWREGRWEEEKRDGVLWTASQMRGVFVVVKFASASVEGGRKWVRNMIAFEGSVRNVVGERGLLCLK